jgi:hypothetical protein
MSLRNQLRVAVGAVSVAAMVAFSSPAVARPTRDIQTGTTFVRLNSIVLGALTANGITPSVLPDSRLVGGVATFPATGGAVDLGAVELEVSHTGGLKFVRGATSVVLSDFIVTTLDEEPVLTGLVTVNGNLVDRVPLFSLGLPRLTAPLRPNPITRRLTIGNVQVKLSAVAASTLNQLFNTTAFSPNLQLGTATVSVIVRNQ